MRTATVMILLASCAGAAMAQAAPFTLGVAPPTRKVFRHSAVPPLPAGGLQLQGAGGEHVSLQLVVTAGESAPVTVDVSTTGPLAGPGGVVLAPRQLTIFRVAYVPDPTQLGASDASTVRWDPELLDPTLDHYPDPLPPWSGPVTVPAGQNQPVWVKVSVPRHFPPGRYRGALQVQAGEQARSVALEVQVWPFTLPLTPTLRTAFGHWSVGFPFPHLENVEPGTAEERDLIQRYYEFLVQHRLSPYALPGGLRSATGQAAARDPRVTSYLLGPAGWEAYFGLRAPGYGLAEGETLLVEGERLPTGVQTALEDLPFAAERGLLPKALAYPGDEPVSRENYQVMRHLAQEIRLRSPRAAIVMPFYDYPNFVEASPVELMAGYTTVWCPLTSLYHEREDLQEELAARRALGEEIWTYVCGEPRGPYCNLFVHQEGIRHRLLIWQIRQAQLEGLLYWATQWWARVNPWESMATYNVDTRFGDGCLLYPGAPVGVRGPVGSQRLECLLLGMQDYEYFTLLRRVAGEAAVQEAIGELVTDWVNYSLDDERLEQVRRRIGERLAEAWTGQTDG